MKIFLRPLAPGETDFELLWFWVSVAAAALATFWLQWQLPIPECPVARWAGLPCPTCGGTRLMRSLFDGNIGHAFRWNPLLFLALVSGVGISACSAVGLGD